MQQFATLWPRGWETGLAGIKVSMPNVPKVERGICSFLCFCHGIYTPAITHDQPLMLHESKHVPSSCHALGHTGRLFKLNKVSSRQRQPRRDRMMATPEESRPLRASLDSNGPESHADHRGKKFALGATAAYLLQVITLCLPPMVRFWHPSFYATLGPEEQRGWTWLGANSLWLALALFWTLLHLDNGPCVATACLLCSLLWAYLLVVLLSQAGRGQLPLSAIAGLVVYVVMLGVCLRTAWIGVAKKSHKARSDGSATWRRVLRKWSLVSASMLFLVSGFPSCWDGERTRPVCLLSIFSKF